MEAGGRTSSWTSVARFASPRRALAGFTGGVLVVVGSQLTVENVFFVPVFWEAAYLLAGLGLVYLALRPAVSFRVRAGIAVVASTSLVARSLALIEAMIQLRAAGGNASPLLVGALVWPLVAAYIVTMLAYWRHLERIERPGGPNRGSG